MYATPNAGKRSYAAASYLRAEGLKRGVPDICLPVPRNGYGALYIELKARNGKPTPEQLEWLAGLTRSGNCALLCYGCDAAWQAITGYLSPSAPSN